jgi:hypothetical protein
MFWFRRETMPRFGFAMLMAASLTAIPLAHADIMLQDFAVNINGTSYDYNNLSQTDPTTLPGMNASGFDTYTSGADTGTGLGTLTYTFNPGVAGSYFVNLYFDYEVSTPFYNEYGQVNGTPGASDPTSWEIFQLNPSVGGIQFYNGSTQIIPNSLDNTNHVPLGNTNYLNNCTVTPCNADVGMALGFAFTLASNQYETLTIDAGTTNPGGFNLEQIHPVDPANATETDLFLSGSMALGTHTGPPPVPEPSFFPVLALAALGVLGIGLRRKAMAR